MMIGSFFRSILFTVCTCIIAQGSLCAEEQYAPAVPTTFLQDVMQPLGVPLVSSYHIMRESLFLNTKCKNSHPLESIGNFFLAPSRYLFAGKTIKITGEEEYEVSQSFHYQKLHWFKTFVSLIALPVSEVLGSTFKGLALLSPEVRKRHQKISKLMKSSHLKSYLNSYREKGIETFHSDSFIPCQGHTRPSRLTKKQTIELKALKEVVNLLNAHNIIYWIDCGTCLGAYRYGGTIPWDWDMDISIFLSDHDNVKKLLSTLDPEKYQIQDWSSYSKPKTFLKLYVKETKNFIDIYHYDLNPEERTTGYVFTYMDSPFPHSWKKAELKCIKPVKYEDMFPLKKAHFDGLVLWAPNNVVAFLQSKYGENLDPAKVWDEATQTYKKVENHPYYQD